MSRFLPLSMFLLLAVLMAFSLLRGGNPAVLDSALLEKPMPQASIPGLSLDKMQEGIILVNFFASWCLSCQVEQKVLERIRTQEDLRLYGIAYKDKAEDTKNWLDKHGNPFDAIGHDAEGRIGLDWGVYGVPETYVLSGGIIRYRHVGPVTEEVYRDILIPLLQRLRT